MYIHIIYVMWQKMCYNFGKNCNVRVILVDIAIPTRKRHFCISKKILIQKTCKNIYKGEYTLYICTYVYILPSKQTQK